MRIIPLVIDYFVFVSILKQEKYLWRQKEKKNSQFYIFFSFFDFYSNLSTSSSAQETVEDS